MHDCFPKQSCMGTARNKQDNDTEERVKQKTVNMERSRAGAKRTANRGVSPTTVLG